MKYEDCKPGDVIPVKIDGKVYETIIDDRGVQRFRENSVLRYMHCHDNKGRELNMHDGRDIHNCMFNLNTLTVAYQQGKFDKLDYMELVMQGYSVSGFMDLHNFAGCVVENPLWGEATTIDNPFEGFDPFAEEN